MAARVLKVLIALLALLIVAVLVYVGYVMLTYQRLDDSLALNVEEPAEGASDGSTLLASIDVQANPELTIATANLGFGAYNQSFDFFMDGGTGSVAESPQVVLDDINGSAAALQVVNPAFLLLQEVDVDGTRSHHIDEYAQLRELFPTYASAFAQNYDSAFLAWPLYAPHGANRAGLVTFSRYAITDALRRSLPISESFSKFLDLDRCYSICRIPTSAGPDLVLLNVHLSAYGADESIMAAQRSMLYEDMQREYAAGNYVIAGGDFNHDMIGVSGDVYDNQVEVVESWAKPYDFDGVPAGFTVGSKAKLDALGVDGFTDAATCRDAGRPYDGTNDRWIMDAFIYSDNVECTAYETLDLDFAYSDHNPVVMKFRLR